MSIPLIIPGTITWEVTFGEIIESIAKEESSLSHILNAGSKKNHGGCGESQRQCRAGDRDQPFGEECHWRNLPSGNDAIGELELFQPIICE